MRPAAAKDAAAVDSRHSVDSPVLVLMLLSLCKEQRDWMELVGQEGLLVFAHQVRGWLRDLRTVDAD